MSVCNENWFGKCQTWPGIEKIETSGQWPWPEATGHYYQPPLIGRLFMKSEFEVFIMQLKI